MDLFKPKNKTDKDKNNSLIPTHNDNQPTDFSKDTEKLYKEIIKSKQSIPFDQNKFINVVSDWATGKFSLDDACIKYGVEKPTYWSWIFSIPALLNVHLRVQKDRQVMRFTDRDKRIEELKTLVSDTKKEYRDRDLYIRLEQVLIKNDELMLKKGNPELFGDKQQLDVTVNESAKSRNDAWNKFIDTGTKDADFEIVQDDEPQ